MFKIKIKEITPERIAECEEFIRVAISMSFEEYQSFFKNNGKYCGELIKDFYRLPKSDIHDEFKEKICKPSREIQIKEAEVLVQQQIADNSKLSQTDFKFTGDSMADRKYKIVKEVFTSDGNILTIGIPYSYLEPGKGYQTKFAYTLSIHEKLLPNLYAKLSDNMIRYDRS